MPTSGELEEISSVDDLTVVEDILADEMNSNCEQETRATPLKSLLKKPSVVNPDMNSTSSDSETESEDGKISPRKVHFCEIDQVKLMSQDSLTSMATASFPPTNTDRIVKQDDLEKVNDYIDTKASGPYIVRKEYIK